MSAAHHLVERAIADAGVADFGPDGWQQGLDNLVSAIEADVVDDEARRRIEGVIVERLATRLRIEAWYAEHESDAAVPVAAPLVIVGLPRTATTAVHFLLSLDPQLRYLRTWERDRPLPPPDLATEPDDPRRVAVEHSAMHIRAVDGPAEDGPIHMLDCRSAHGLPLPSYERWWRSTRHPTAFAYQERVLRMLHAHRPPHRWLLKYPAYTSQIDDLLVQWPSATLIWTHRDPRKLVPSTCSVVVDGRRRRVPDWEPDDWSAFGHEQLERFAEAARRGVEARARIGEGRFVDVAQHEMEADVIAVAERIYAAAGLALGDDLRAVMGEWAVHNARGSRGAHTYSAEQYGLTDGEIVAAFASYFDRFADLL